MACGRTLRLPEIDSRNERGWGETSGLRKIYHDMEIRIQGFHSRTFGSISRRWRCRRPGYFLWHSQASLRENYGTNNATHAAVPVFVRGELVVSF